MASGGCSVVFLFLETLSSACACNMVSLEFLEKLEDLIVGQECSIRVYELTEGGGV